jgi:ureidoacrylate peracid hydrolase
MPHNFEMPQKYIDAVTGRMGREHSQESFDTEKTALVVVDMQNYFMDESQQAGSPVAQTVVDNVNRIADTVRRTGGIVIWIQNLAPADTRESWKTAHERYLPEKADLRVESMTRGAWPFELWPTLDVKDDDFRVTKRRYSAFIQGSSDIELILKDNSIENILVCGVATNVCCESTARDAMMLNYRALMVSDGCATASDEEHGNSLIAFYSHFGDVQNTDELCARLEASDRKNSAADAAE